MYARRKADAILRGEKGNEQTRSLCVYYTRTGAVGQGEMGNFRGCGAFLFLRVVAGVTGNDRQRSARGG
jgi:hypothetical protein